MENLINKIMFYFQIVFNEVLIITFSNLIIISSFLNLNYHRIIVFISIKKIESFVVILL